MTRTGRTDPAEDERLAEAWRSGDGSAIPPDDWIDYAAAGVEGLEIPESVNVTASYPIAEVDQSGGTLAARRFPSGWNVQEMKARIKEDRMGSDPSGCLQRLDPRRRRGCRHRPPALQRLVYFSV